MISSREKESVPIIGSHDRIACLLETYTNCPTSSCANICRNSDFVAVLLESDATSKRFCATSDRFSGVGVKYTLVPTSPKAFFTDSLAIHCVLNQPEKPCFLPCRSK